MTWRSANLHSRQNRPKSSQRGRSSTPSHQHHVIRTSFTEHRRDGTRPSRCRRGGISHRLPTSIRPERSTYVQQQHADRHGHLGPTEHIWIRHRDQLEHQVDGKVDGFRSNLRRSGSFARYHQEGVGQDPIGISYGRCQPRCRGFSSSFLQRSGFEY